MMPFHPRYFVYEDFPLIVFSDHTSGVIEFLIKFRTKGTYNHVMIMRRPGFFASQGNTYSEVPIHRYMDKGNRLKFVEIAGLTPVQKELIKASIERKLKLPWYKKMYDWVGIVGQAIGIKEINICGLNYCSEDVVCHLIPLIEHTEGQLKEAIASLPIHGSPDDLVEYFKLYPNIFVQRGKWESDEHDDCGSIKSTT